MVVECRIFTYLVHHRSTVARKANDFFFLVKCLLEFNWNRSIVWNIKSDKCTWQNFFWNTRMEKPPYLEEKNIENGKNAPGSTHTLNVCTKFHCSTNIVRNFENGRIRDKKMLRHKDRKTAIFWQKMKIWKNWKVCSWGIRIMNECTKFNWNRRFGRYVLWNRRNWSPVRRIKGRIISRHELRAIFYKF